MCPTLPEWGMIFLGVLLLGIAQRGQRRVRGKTGGPGSLAALFSLLAGVWQWSAS